MRLPGRSASPARSRVAAGTAVSWRVYAGTWVRVCALAQAWVRGWGEGIRPSARRTRSACRGRSVQDRPAPTP